jgi:hypothetical protein
VNVVIAVAQHLGEHRPGCPAALGQDLADVARRGAQERLFLESADPVTCRPALVEGFLAQLAMNPEAALGKCKKERAADRHGNGQPGDYALSHEIPR